MNLYEQQMLLADLMRVNREAEIKDFVEALRANRHYDSETAIKVNRIRIEKEESAVRKKIYTVQGFKGNHYLPGSD